MRRALKLLALLLTACSPSPQASNNAANELLRQGRAQEALRAYQAAQVVQPDQPVYYFNAAAALAELGQSETAALALRQAIQRGDEALQANAHYNLGNLYLAQADYPSAIQAYQQAILLRPDFEDARFNLELALSYLDRPTPTPMEMNTRPDEQQADTSATPTPNPSGMNAPSPTPPRVDPGANERERLLGEPGGLPGGDKLDEDTEGNLNIESARRLLEEIPRPAPGLGGLRPTTTPLPIAPTWKDW
ncbi:MAG: tetratricopeptide repeat protein [Anaerolineae bacterium]|nr:tetratricopeptide repeat protein [Anaerolineae bacterium]MDW8171396.1 tetratricopeptide repeat protein [Anaerolineae bacterium]